MLFLIWNRHRVQFPNQRKLQVEADGMNYLFSAHSEMGVCLAHDGSVTLSLNEIDLVENGQTEDEAKWKLADSILEYSENFYNDFNYWSTAPNRKAHIPYAF